MCRSTDDLPRHERRHRSEVVAAEPVDLGEDRLDIFNAALHRLQQHAAPETAHPHLLPRQAKVLRQTYGLAAAMLEQLRCLGVTHGFTLQFEE
jgi:hypothetical protein